MRSGEETARSAQFYTSHSHCLTKLLVVLMFFDRVMQVMSPNAAQLTAAVAALINALVASKFATTGVMG